MDILYQTADCSIKYVRLDCVYSITSEIPYKSGICFNKLISYSIKYNTDSNLILEIVGLYETNLIKNELGIDPQESDSISNILNKLLLKNLK